MLRKRRERLVPCPLCRHKNADSADICANCNKKLEKRINPRDKNNNAIGFVFLIIIIALAIHYFSWQKVWECLKTINDLVK